MKRKEVVSSNLKSVGYDQITKLLEIEFKGGRLYQYSSVPPQIYEGLMNAASKGKFFHAHIRDTFSYKKIV